jgi:hypothetical protein
MIVSCFIAIHHSLRWGLPDSRISSPRWCFSGRCQHGSDRVLIRNPVAEHVDSRKQPHRRHHDQGILHSWITERAEVLLLHQVDPLMVLKG